MRFLVDAQLPPALARLLAERGHIAEHVTDIGPGDASDDSIWTYALENNAVLVTKDGDFRDMLLLRGSAPVVVWIRLGNTRRRALIEWVTPQIDQIVDHITSGEQFIELR